MKIEIVTPGSRAGWTGNRVTAERWSRLLDDLGHDTAISGAWSGAPVDVLVALHARKSVDSVRRFAEERPGAPIVLALTGTDVYRDLERSAEARAAVDLAAALVVLQPLARDRVPAARRDRVRVIHQSVAPPADPPPSRQEAFEVAVIANLRDVKDPFLAAEAVRLLPAGSRVQVVHCGAPIDHGTADRAAAEDRSNPRYRWLGAVPRPEALRVLARARLLVLTSRLEGGANVVSEAIAAGTPVVSTRIDGSVGLLGHDYPGYVPVGDAPALAALLHRVESDPALLADLAGRVAALRPLVEPARERQAWADLLAALDGGR